MVVSQHCVDLTPIMWKGNWIKLSQRLLSTSYRGKRIAGQADNFADLHSFQRVRGKLARPSTAPSSGPEPNRLLFRREEAIAARFLGPLAIFNVGGALFFCATVVNGDRNEQSKDTSGDAFFSADVMRTAACSVALCSAAGVILAANRFNRSRLIELRTAGHYIQLYTRSMAGVPSVILAKEVPVGCIAFDFSRMRIATKVREENLGKAVTRKNNDSFVSINILSPDGAREGKDANVGFTIDTLDASILDADGLRSVAKDSSAL